jgi:Sulfotransferase family
MPWASDQEDLAARARQIERRMDHWRAVLPLRMVEIDYETLVADLESECRRLIVFLGLEWDPSCLAFNATERAVTKASYWQVRQPLYSSSVGRRGNYPRHLGPLLHGLTGLVPADDGDRFRGR